MAYIVIRLTLVYALDSPDTCMQRSPLRHAPIWVFITFRVKHDAQMRFCFVQATVLQSGSGGLFLGVATAANISYAGGKNTTYVQANGAANGIATVADVQYTTTGAVCITTLLG